MSLIISVSGGIGNQFFILFAGISKAIEEKRDFKILIQKSVNEKRPYYFDNYLNFLNDKIIYDYNEKDKKVFYLKSHNYEEIPDNMDLLIGNFENYRYFNDNYEKIKEIMKINELQKLFNVNQKIIAIHFRLGDFIDIPDAVVLNDNYYIKGLKLLQEKLEKSFDDYKIIIFGNKENKDLIYYKINIINSYFENKLNIYLFNDIYDSLNDFEDFIFMSCCNHFIIANSTFSWMASYLSSNKEKIIIHPPEYLHYKIGRAHV